jgi:hypothetical protein
MGRLVTAPEQAAGRGPGGLAFFLGGPSPGRRLSARSTLEHKMPWTSASVSERRAPTSHNLTAGAATLGYGALGVYFYSEQRRSRKWVYKRQPTIEKRFAQLKTDFEVCGTWGR